MFTYFANIKNEYLKKIKDIFIFIFIILIIKNDGLKDIEIFW